MQSVHARIQYMDVVDVTPVTAQRVNGGACKPLLPVKSSLYAGIQLPYKSAASV